MSDDLFYYPNESAWEAANPIKFVSTNGSFSTANKTLYNAALASCAPLSASGSLTKQCTPYIDNTDDVYQACLFDIMVSGELNFGDGDVDAYAAQCSMLAAQVNVTISMPPPLP
jgi:hypothetical protein